MENLILKTDSYKPSHSKIYPPGTQYMQSYYESRASSKEIVFFGLQYILKRHLQGSVVDIVDVQEAEKFFKDHYGRDDVFDKEGWGYIADKLGGKLPIRIYALPEGTVADSRTPLMVVESTDPKVFWVVNYLETLLCQIWYPTTIATNSRNSKQVIRSYMRMTTDMTDDEISGALDFKLHDFGYRGVSCFEQAGVGGMSHLTSFSGTDTLAAIEFAREYYNTRKMVGASIPATEHSTTTSWGGPEGESKAMKALLDAYPTGLIACVSDSYDIIHAVENIWGDELREQVLNREGTLVVRPDSGDPVVATEKVFEALWAKFGGSVSMTGHRILDPHVRIIQGDGIDHEMIIKILSNFYDKKISAENIAFGSGGGLLQKVNRDTYKFAFKCNQIIRDGKEVDVRKKPMEFDSEGNYELSNKWSKAGDLHDTPGLELVYENGEILKEYTFEEVRERINN